MNTNRKTAVLAGVLFVIGTISGILSGVVTAPIMAGATYPNNIDANETQWVAGVLLVLLMGLPLAMLPVVLYPLFKEHNIVLALGAVLFRGALEAVCYVVLAISMLMLLTVSQMHTRLGAEAAPQLQALGTMLIAAGIWTTLILGLVFSVGGMMIYILFFQTRLIPQWLSGWGIVGALLYFLAHLESLLGSQQIVTFEAGFGFLLIPLAVQEMVFAVWMIVKGFGTSAMTADAVRGPVTAGMR